MKISKMRLTCKCGHVFDAEIVTQAPVAVAVASMNAVRCVKCGAQGRDLTLGGEMGGRPAATASLAIRTAWWIEMGEVGISSRTIYGAFAGDFENEPDIPKDPDDFRRCRQLFDLIPEWRANLNKLTETYPWFRPFVERWNEMDRLYEEEAASKSCPKLYHLMKLAEVESLRIRYPKAQIETRSDGTLSSMRLGRI